MRESKHRMLGKVLVFLGMVALVELGVFRMVYNDIWVLDRFIAHPNPQTVSTLDKVFLATIQAPQNAQNDQKLMKLATAYNEVGDKNHLVAVYRRILEVHPENRKVRLDLANTLQAMGKYEEAASEYERLLRKPNQ